MYVGAQAPLVHSRAMALNEQEKIGRRLHRRVRRRCARQAEISSSAWRIATPST